MTHAHLVRLAYLWLLKSGGCGVAFHELVTQEQEQPDAIGFSGAYSVLVECKTSRADFHADKKKWFRIQSERGMGDYRYYLCPWGLIKETDLPAKWGLIYVHQNEITTETIVNPLKHRHAKDQDWKFTANKQAEMSLMYSALRRLHLRRHIESIYDQPYKREEQRSILVPQNQQSLISEEVF